jgi:hypothetical protein
MASMLAIILFCIVSFRQRKVSIFKPPRHNHYLLRFVSAKYLATKNKPILIAIITSSSNSTNFNHFYSHPEGFSAS